MFALAMGTARIGTLGPYGLVRALARAPAAWLVEATDPTGLPTVLQLTRLRAATSPEELAERARCEARITAETDALRSERALGLGAQGAVDRPDGTRVLYWVLDARARIPDLGATTSRITSAEALAKTGLALARRLARRHALGRVDPLLFEDLVAIGPDAEDVALVGVPLFLPPAWLVADMRTSRLAPEELDALTPTRSGDLWRLGQALAALGAHLDALPFALRRVIERLAAPDVAHRPARATDAIAELEAVRSILSHGTGPLPFDHAETVNFSALGPDTLSELFAHAAGRTTGSMPITAVDGLLSVHEDSVAFDSLAPFAMAALTASERPASISGLGRAPSVRSTPPLTPVERLVPGEGGTPTPRLVLEERAELEPAADASDEEETVPEPTPRPALRRAASRASSASSPPSLPADDASPWSGAAVAARLGPRSEERVSPFSEPRLFAPDEPRALFLELDDVVSEVDITQVQPAVARRWTLGAVLALMSAVGLFAFFLASR